LRSFRSAKNQSSLLPLHSHHHHISQMNKKEEPAALYVRNFFFISHLFVCDTRAPLSFSPPFSKVNQARGNLLFPDPQFLSLGFLSVSAICRPTHFIPCSIFSPHFQSISFHFFPLCWEPCKNKYTYQWAWGFFNIFLAYCSRDVPRPLSAQPFP
jgi:hypothetical protein